MKFTIVMLSLVLSVSVLQSALASSTAEPSYSRVRINPKAQANLVINDFQLAMNTGIVSLFLSEKIQGIQSQNEDISESEALDILLENAQETLAK